MSYPTQRQPLRAQQVQISAPSSVTNTVPDLGRAFPAGDCDDVVCRMLAGDAEHYSREYNASLCSKQTMLLGIVGYVIDYYYMAPVPSAQCVNDILTS